jgi:hypothetical protein
MSGSEDGFGREFDALLQCFRPGMGDTKGCLWDAFGCVDFGAFQGDIGRWKASQMHIRPSGSS